MEIFDIDVMIWFVCGGFTLLILLMFSGKLTKHRSHWLAGFVMFVLSGTLMVSLFGVAGLSLWAVVLSVVAPLIFDWV